MNKSQKMYESAAMLKQALREIERAIKILPASEQFIAGQTRAAKDLIESVTKDVQTRAKEIRGKK